MVHRIYIEKKPELANEAKALKSEINNILGITALNDVRILNRYDAEGLSDELFATAVRNVFSEPQLDLVYDELPDAQGGYVFAVEYLPGQFDQRADSAAQCIQIISCSERPLIRTATIYILSGNLSQNEIDAIEKYVINPVEARKASLELPATLVMEYETPSQVSVVEGFTSLDSEGLAKFVNDYSLAMDVDDIAFCQDYFIKENRNPTITEIKLIDTYWSDHCRHTTFSTTIDNVTFEDETLQNAYDDYLKARESIGRTKPVNLMDIGTLAAKCLKQQGLLDKLDESEEINACTVKITVTVDGVDEPWLLLFKNETHNHPTEIEPFGGAATCIGGAIRDPLSGRSYVYAAMRVTGAADPTVPISETLAGKLPQRKIVQTAAHGYSSYGNQIGLATGMVSELYHPGYAAKRMEVGAVIAAAPACNVRRERPESGDVIILLGGRTGRDGIGGATGSSKAHTTKSVESCGAEVQKGNAPEERKLQRLFRNPAACRMIKRCNDFGAGGVSVAIGELADGLLINLDKVSKKYEGLDGTELAISESQERMAVVVSPEDSEKFMEIAFSENLEASIVATVTEEARLKMTWKDKTIVDISREFLDSNGAEKHIEVKTPELNDYKKTEVADFVSAYKSLLADLNVCSQRGLSERFDSTIGSGSVLMPFGGKFQRTPIQSMVHKVSVEKGHTDTCSFMSWGYNPYITEKSPYHGAYIAVLESLSKLVAQGANLDETYLSFQEYFEKPMRDPGRWGKPFAALLGAFKAQMDFGVAAIGGKDSMSGTFEKLDVPPTLISFAVTTGNAANVISPEFKKAGHKVILVSSRYPDNLLPSVQSQKNCFKAVNKLMSDGQVYSGYTPGFGGIAEAVYKMCIGNGIGFEYCEGLDLNKLFAYAYGSFVLEVNNDFDLNLLLNNEDYNSIDCIDLGQTVSDLHIKFGTSVLTLSELDNIYESKLEGIYPTLENKKYESAPCFNFTKSADFSCGIAYKNARPTVLIPVFPGTNCEFDSAKAMEDAGANSEIFVINNLSADGISRSVEEFAQKLSGSQMLFIPGGFSGGDEPDGSAKFITAFLRNEQIKNEVHNLINNRDGLILGICNGFQALIKTGLLPYGKIMDTDEFSATLTFNTIARHQSKQVRIRVASDNSPWLANAKVGDIYTVPVSHGEGRFFAPFSLIEQLSKNGQIATQYVDLDGNPTMDIRFNPNGSGCAIEGILSPNGHVLGKMGHSERIGSNMYKNVPGNYDMGLFKSAVKYFN